ncbi:hypothetical protein Q7P37_007528 [Cladosporium fusiforme]
MHSFRALARSAPRATARLTASSTRASIRPAFTSSIRTQAPRALTAAFSTSRPTFDASAQELAAKLTSELQLESENADSNQTASDSNVQDFLSRTDWKLHDVDGEQIVKLSRKFEDELVEVRFTIADFNNPYPEHEDADEALYDEEMELGDAQSGGANTKGAINQGNSRDGNFKVAPEDNVAPADREGLADEEDNSEPAFPANVNVLISRPSKKNAGALRINLVSDSSNFTVNSVAHLPSADLPEAQIADEPLPSEKMYSGPPFPQLDEDLQALLETYLNDRGVDTELAMFIPEYIDVKEQKEYLGWLKKVKDFVE